MWLLALNLGEILREFEEILGKYRILDESSVGSKGLNKEELSWAPQRNRRGANMTSCTSVY